MRLAFLTAIIAYEGQMEPARPGGLVQYFESREGNERPLQVILAGISGYADTPLGAASLALWLEL
jgi:hypothetical protein